MKVTREQILDTARRHFARSGFRKASLAAIASDLGVVKGALYYHVPGGKKEMLEACVRQVEDAVLARMRQAVEGERDPEKALHALVEAKLAVLAALRDELDLTEDVGEEIKTLMTSQARPFHAEERELIASVIESGQNLGVFTTEQSRHLAAVALQALVRHVELVDIFATNGESRSRGLVDLVLQGLVRR